MIFPIGDTNVKGGFKPLFSYSFIAINILFFFVQLSYEGNLVCELATVPHDIVEGENLYTLITSMFMHGGWMHLIGNMMFLWVFADNIEAVLGNIHFLIFYILGGLFASAFHIFFEIQLGDPNILNCCKPCLAGVTCEDIGNICGSFTPALGASGAISAVLGAYLVLFPKSRIKVFFFITTFTIPALAFLGLWFLEQLISGVGALGKLGAAAGGVAWWAHIGGFVFGLVFGFLNRNIIRKMRIDDMGD